MSVFTRRRGPVTLAQVVEDLAVRWSDPGDWPAEHRCTPGCTHKAGRDAPLMARLQLLVAPSRSLWRQPQTGKRGRGPQGSPAPWAAGPAELVDEVLRGAVDFDARLRRILDFGPLHVQLPPPRPDLAGRRLVGPLCAPGGCRHGSCTAITRQPGLPVTVTADRAPLDFAGMAALRGLPLLVDLLTERRPASPLVRGRLVDPDKPGRGYRPGEVEAAVRSWQRRALVITGHDTPDPVVREMANPVHGLTVSGPLCEMAHCAHDSCLAIELAADPREWIPPACPICGGQSLPQDQVTGLIYCDRARCIDPATGRRPEWSIETLRGFGLDLDAIASLNRHHSPKEITMTTTHPASKGEPGVRHARYVGDARAVLSGPNLYGPDDHGRLYIAVAATFDPDLGRTRVKFEELPTDLSDLNALLEYWRSRVGRS